MARFGRPADDSPMMGLKEWHVGQSGLQLFEAADNAGRCTVTIMVDDVQEQHKRLSDAGFKPGEVQQANYTTVFRLRDPDGNLVVLAQPTQQ